MHEYMSMEEHLQNILVQIKTLEAYLNDLTLREASIIRLIEEGRLASDALRGLGSNNLNTFVPIGMGVYVQSNINSDAKFLINIGAGISIEKDREYAISFIDNRLRELESALNNISMQKRDIEAKLEQARREANELIISIQKEQGKV